MSRDDLSFEAVVRGAFGKAGGLAGGIGIARLEGDSLRIAGERNQELVVPAAQVDCMRIVHFSGSRQPAIYEARIWPKGGSESLLVMAAPRRPGDYGAVIKGFAGHVADLEGIDRVMRGPSLRTAIVSLLLAGGSVTLLAAGIVLVAVFDGGWGWWLAAMVAVALDLLLLASSFRNRWPRRVRNLDELDRELPPNKERQP